MVGPTLIGVSPPAHPPPGQSNRSLVSPGSRSSWRQVAARTGSSPRPLPASLMAWTTPGCSLSGWPV